jgi:hypothetical protein
MSEELTLADYARGVYELLRRIKAVPELTWDHGSAEAQFYCVKIGRVAIEKMESAMAGLTPHQAGQKLAELCLKEPRVPMTPLAWEAVARLCHMLIDCDELTSVDDAVGMWADWHNSRVSRAAQTA